MKSFKEKLKKTRWEVILLTLLIFLLIPVPVETCDILFSGGCGISIVSGYYALLPMIVFLFFGRFINLLFLSITIGISYFIARTIYNFFRDRGTSNYSVMLLAGLIIFELFLFLIYNPILPREDQRVSDTLFFINNNNSGDFHLCEKINIPFKRIGYPNSDYYITEIDRMKKLCFERTYNNKLSVIKEKLNAGLCDDFKDVKNEGVYLKSRCYYDLAPITLNESLCKYKFSENNTELNVEMQNHCIYNTKKEISGGIFVDGFVTPVDNSTKLGIIPITDYIERALSNRNIWIPLNNTNGYFRYDSLPLRFKWGDSPEYIEDIELYVEKDGLIYRDNFTCSIQGYNFNCHFLINLNKTPAYKNRNLIIYTKKKYSDNEILSNLVSSNADSLPSKIVSEGYENKSGLNWYELEYDASLLNSSDGEPTLFIYNRMLTAPFGPNLIEVIKSTPVYVTNISSNFGIFY